VTVVAFECYADQDLVHFLRDVAQIGIKKRHSYSQGEVINDLLKKDVADVAIVDEDPGAAHHRLRDSLPVIQANSDVEIRAAGRKSIVIVKPDLERCFLRSMERLSLATSLPTLHRDLHRRLASSNHGHSDHKRFRDELSVLRQAALERHVVSFVTTIEAHIRSRLAGS
jgi:hypothetical protein